MLSIANRLQVGLTPTLTSKFMRAFSWERTQPSKLSERVRIPSPAPIYPCVAQPGRAPGLGPGGRMFESCHTDQLEDI